MRINVALRRLVSVFAALFLLAAAALAGPLQDANRAYGRGDYQEALRLIRQAEQQEPNNPVGLPRARPDTPAARRRERGARGA